MHGPSVRYSAAKGANKGAEMGQKCPPKSFRPHGNEFASKSPRKQRANAHWYAHPFAGLPPAARPFRPCGEPCYTRVAQCYRFVVRPHPLVRLRSYKKDGQPALSPRCHDLPVRPRLRYRSGQTGARYGCTTGVTDSAAIAAENPSGFFKKEGRAFWSLDDLAKTL